MLCKAQTCTITSFPFPQFIHRWSIWHQLFELQTLHFYCLYTVGMSDRSLLSETLHYHNSCAVWRVQHRPVLPQTSAYHSSYTVWCVQHRPVHRHPLTTVLGVQHRHPLTTVPTQFGVYNTDIRLPQFLHNLLCTTQTSAYHSSYTIWCVQHRHPLTTVPTQFDLYNTDLYTDIRLPQFLHSLACTTQTCSATDITLPQFLHSLMCTTQTCTQTSAYHLPQFLHSLACTTQTCSATDITLPQFLHSLMCTTQTCTQTSAYHSSYTVWHVQHWPVLPQTSAYHSSYIDWHVQHRPVHRHPLTTVPTQFDLYNTDLYTDIRLPQFLHSLACTTQTCTQTSAYHSSYTVWSVQHRPVHRHPLTTVPTQFGMYNTDLYTDITLPQFLHNLVCTTQTSAYHSSYTVWSVQHRPVHRHPLTTVPTQFGVYNTDLYTDITLPQFLHNLVCTTQTSAYHSSYTVWRVQHRPVHRHPLTTVPTQFGVYNTDLYTDITLPQFLHSAVCKTLTCTQTSAYHSSYTVWSVQHRPVHRHPLTTVPTQCVVYNTDLYYHCRPPITTISTQLLCISQTCSATHCPLPQFLHSCCVSHRPVLPHTVHYHSFYTAAVYLTDLICHTLSITTISTQLLCISQTCFATHCPLPQFLHSCCVSHRPEARCPARRMLVNAREWRNNASWSSVAYTTSDSKARSNGRWRGRSLAFKTRWRMCFSYKSFTFICFHANFSSFSFVDRQNTYSYKSDLFAN